MPDRPPGPENTGIRINQENIQVNKFIIEINVFCYFKA